MGRREFIAVGALGTTGLLLGSAPGEAQETDREDYVFAVIADPHLREDREGEPTGVEKFRALLQRLNEEAPEARFALLLGDIHPEKLEPLLPEIDLPLHVVHGNHERVSHREMLRGMFPDDFGQRDYYSFEHNEDLFVAMSTATPGDHVGHLQSEYIAHSIDQLKWLERLLSRRDEWRHVFLYGHIPPEEQSRAVRMCIARIDARWLHDLVVETRPTALFFGHRHRRINFAIDAVPVYGVRSTNWNFEGEPRGGMIVTVREGGIDTRFVPTVAGE